MISTYRKQIMAFLLIAMLYLSSANLIIYVRAWDGYGEGVIETESSQTEDELGTWVSKKGMPTARSNLAAVSVDQKIYAIGGFVYKDGKYSATSLVEIYDTSTDTWTTGKSLPVASGLIGAVTIGRKIYVLAGETSQLFVFDVDKNEWSELQRLPADANTGSFGMAVVSGKIYVARGSAEYPSGIYWTYCYDPQINVWTGKSPIPYHRTIESFAELNGKLYAIGGADPSLGRRVEHTRIDVYDPATDQWTLDAIPRMSTPRTHLEPETPVANGKIYIIGGWDGYSTLNTVEVYDPVTNSWKTISPMPTARYALATAVVNGKIYAIGGDSGGYGGNPKTANEEFTPPRWTPPTPPSQVYVLHVQSSPITGVTISYSGDYSGSGATNFDVGPKEAPFTVSLKAPLVYADYKFGYWLLDGVNMGQDNSITVSVDDEKSERTAIAVYSKEEIKYTLHVKSEPITGVSISYSGDFTGSGTTNFDIGPTDSPFTVTLTAPSTYQNYKFDHWKLDGEIVGYSNSITVTVNDQKRERVVLAYYVKTAPSIAPSLISPVDGAILSRSVVTFSWSPVPEATYYELLITGPNLALDLVYIADTSYSTSLVISGSYTWKVRGYNSAGYGPWSTSWNFTNLYPALLKISSITVDADVLCEPWWYFVNPGESVKISLQLLNGENKLHVRVNLCVKDPGGVSIYDSKESNQDKEIWLDPGMSSEITFNIPFPEVCNSPIYLVYATVTDWDDPTLTYDSRGGWENSPLLWTVWETENAFIINVPYSDKPPSTFGKTLEAAITFILKQVIGTLIKEIIGKLAGTIVGSILGVFMFAPAAGIPPKSQLYLVTESTVSSSLVMHVGEKANIGFIINTGDETPHSFSISCWRAYQIYSPTGIDTWKDELIWTEEVPLYHANDFYLGGIYQGQLKCSIVFDKEGYYVIECSIGSGANKGEAKVLIVDGSSLTVSVKSPVDILLTDPTGRRCGYDPKTGIVNEIEGAYYSGPSAEPETIVIPDPLHGKYHLSIYESELGNYTIEIQSTNPNRTVIGKIVQSYVSTNKTGFYEFYLQNDYALIPEQGTKQTSWWIQYQPWIITGVIGTASVLTVLISLIIKRKRRARPITK